MKRITIGQLCVGVGIIHNLFGLTASLMPVPGTTRRLLPEIMSQGIVNSIDPDPFRMALFWFMWFGWAIMIAGATMHHLERANGTLPWSVGLGFLSMCAIGCVMMPISGFWIAAAVGALAIFRTWRHGHSCDQPPMGVSSVSHP